MYGRALERSARPLGMAPLQRDADADRFPQVRHRVLPVGLAAPAHHDEVARPGGQIVGRALAGRVRRAGWSAAAATRPSGAEAEHDDHRVLEVAHVGVAVERLTVGRPPVLDHAEAVEQHPVPPLQQPVGFGEGRMGERAAGPPPRTETALLDEVVVAEEASTGPRDRSSNVVKSSSAPAIQPRDTSTQAPAPRSTRSNSASGSTCGGSITAGRRPSAWSPGRRRWSSPRGSGRRPAARSRRRSGSRADRQVRR